MRKGYKKGAAAVAAVATLMVAPARSSSPKSDTGQAPNHTSVAIAASRRGRPRKFNRPSRAVTLTLPDDVIATLSGIDTDLSRAVVRAVQPLVPEAPRSPAELTMYGTRAVISVPHTRALRHWTGVELVPMSDGRALISFDDRLSIPQFELRLRDAIADPALEDDDRATFEAVAQILQDARRSDGIDLRQRSIMVLQRTNAGGANGVARRRSGGSEA